MSCCVDTIALHAYSARIMRRVSRLCLPGAAIVRAGWWAGQAA